MQGLLKTVDAVSPNLEAGTVLLSLIVFVLIYAVLIAIDVYLLAKYSKAGPDAEKQEPVDVAPSVVGAQG